MKENKKYSTPELEVIELDCEDIIQTRGNLGLTEEDKPTVPGKPVIMSTGTPTEINYFE